MARSKNSESRSTISIRFDSENEEWLRIYAAFHRKTLADVVNVLIKEQRQKCPITIAGKTSIGGAA